MYPAGLPYLEKGFYLAEFLLLSRLFEIMFEKVHYNSSVGFVESHSSFFHKSDTVSVL